MGELAATDFGAAEALFEQRTRQELELREQQVRMELVLSGRGCRDLAALDLALAELTAACDQLRQGQRPEGVSDVAAELTRLDERRAELRTLREKARGETELLARHVRDANDACAHMDGAIAELVRQAEESAARVAGEEAEIADEALASQLAAANERLDRAADHLAIVERQVAVADSALVRDKLAQAERRMRALEAEHRRLGRIRSSSSRSS